MATVNFLYRSMKENAPLNIRLLYRFNDVDYTIGGISKLSIYSNSDLIENPELNAKVYWTKKHKQTVFKKTSDASEIRDINVIKNKQTEVNTEMIKLENYVLKAFHSTNIEDINIRWFKNLINIYYNPPRKNGGLPNELVKYFDKYIEFKKNEIKTGTIKKINVTKHLVMRYEKRENKTLLISDIDFNFKLHFEFYCKENGYAHNTIAKDIRGIKTICLHAKYNGIETSYQLENIKANYISVEKIFLTFDELGIIEKTDMPERLNNARDWLIISCFTGQRVSDFMKFTKEMIRKTLNKNGEEVLLIEFTQQKTDSIMSIPLFPKVIEILSRRNGDFPRPISNQKYNDYIKEVCKLAEVNEQTKGSKILETEIDNKIFRKKIGIYEKWNLVSSHIGRRSFATNYYGTIPTSLLKNVTGHKSEAMFLNYIGKANSDMAIELSDYI
jgi:integrase